VLPGVVLVAVGLVVARNRRVQRMVRSWFPRRALGQRVASDALRAAGIAEAEEQREQVRRRWRALHDEWSSGPPKERKAELETQLEWCWRTWEELEAARVMYANARTEFDLLAAQEAAAKLAAQVGEAFAEGGAFHRMRQEAEERKAEAKAWRELR
jgi:hypothetical protein